MPNKYEVAREWMGDPIVEWALLNTLGMLQGVEIPKNVNLLDDSEENRYVMSQTVRAYSVVSNTGINDQKRGRSPARSMPNWGLMGELIQNPISDIGTSIRPRSLIEYEQGNWKPQDMLCFLDVELFDKHNPAEALVNQLGTLRRIEPIFEIITKLLDRLNIPHMSTLTGRGYHFSFRVDGSSAAMDGLIDIGRSVEPEVLERHQFDHHRNKRQYPIHPTFEMAFRGATILQQFLALQIQRECRGTSLHVTFSDLGDRGIAIDNTTMLRHAGTAKIMVCPGFWIKPLVNPDKYGGEAIVNNTRLITRLPRGNSNVGQVNRIEDLVAARQKINRAKRLLEEFAVGVPDASQGMQKLIADYKKSELKKLQDQLDQHHQIDEQVRWNSTYRNYSGITQNYPAVTELIRYPNPALLQPESLRFFVNTLVDAGWQPIHIVGLLSAIYNDPNIQWGRGFERHDIKVRRAWGWVFIILSQALVNEV